MSKQTPLPFAVLRGHATEVTSILFHPQFSLQKPILFSGDLSGQLVLWNTSTRRIASSFPNVHSLSILHLDTLSENTLCR